jgi:cyclopropane-fatty-acyl-phospholipid synthase
MSLKSALGALAERAPLPDAMMRAGIASRVARTRRRLASLDGGAEDARFAASMLDRPIAEFTQVANAQHYELPSSFFELVLGPHRKYSSCLYATPGETLAAAEEHALAASSEHAALADGQSILELGCGWGSLSLWMATHFPRARITAVSNSRPQRLFIEQEAVARGLRNLTVVTADVNQFAPEGQFDRIVSIEMFEHVANWPALLERVVGWLKPDGRLFLHVFSHRAVPYRFDHDSAGDWIARHFFTGGIMPSHGLLRHCTSHFAFEEAWQWSGTHYQRTALHWLENFDRRLDEIRPILDDMYGYETPVWLRRWRLFFLATAGLFGDSGGNEWGVSHYRLRPIPF